MSARSSGHASGLRVGIDGEALLQPLSGVGKYVYHLCRELESWLPDAEFYVYARVAAERLALPSPRWRLRREAVPALRRLPSFVWLKARGAALCEADALDVFWAGRTLHPRLGPNVHTVCSVHDLNHLLVPRTMQPSTLWSHRLWFEGDLRRAGAVIANSQATRDRLQRHLKVEVAQVICPGLDAAFEQVPLTSTGALAALAQLDVRPPYLLAVATLEPRKNIEVLLRAFVALKGEGQLLQHQLVIVGARGWQNRALERALRGARGLGVRLPGYVPDLDMPALYAAADALVCPSLYEGFGMPVLEARACGTRVVISDLPELREAGGPYAVRVEPTLHGVRAGIIEALATPRRPEPGLSGRHSWRAGAESLARLLNHPTAHAGRVGDPERPESAPASSARPSIAIGIASAGRRQQLGLTLGQLARQNVLPERVVICPAGVEDYDETDGRGLGCPVEVVRAARGLCAQRNAILRACRSADILIFIDDDFYPVRDYVERVVELFGAHEDIVIATHHPPLDGASGPGVTHEEAVLALASLERSPPARGTRPIAGAYGCNMALRLSSVFRHGLWFDENLPLYGWLEDLDFSHRLGRHGRVVECGALRGVHLGIKRGRTSGVRLGYSQIANPVYMLRKGSLTPRYALLQMLKNVTSNSLRSLRPEPWVDRWGRLEGNLIAVGDLVKGELHPEKAAAL